MTTPDHLPGDLDTPGLYRVWYGRVFLPAGPFPDLATLAATLELGDHPSDGHLVHVDDDGAVSSVPSLNPDELYQPPCVTCRLPVRQIGGEWVHVEAYDRDGDLDTAARCEDGDDLVARDETGEALTADPGDEFDPDGLPGEQPPAVELPDDADGLVALWDAGAEPATVAVALDALRPTTAVVSIRQLTALDSFAAGDNLELVLVGQVADAAWAAGLDATATVTRLWRHASRALPRRWRQTLELRVPPLTGVARSHAADVLVALGQTPSRRAAFTTIDQRRHGQLTPVACRVLHDLASKTPADPRNVAALLEASGLRAALPQDDAVLYTVGDGQLYYVRAGDWSVAIHTTVEPAATLPTGLSADERDPWTVAAALGKLPGR